MLSYLYNNIKSIEKRLTIEKRYIIIVSKFDKEVFMENIFNLLYYGNISVFDDKEIFSSNKKEFEQFTKIQSIFEKSLNVKQKELYEKYCSAQNDLDSKYQEKIFEKGMKIGLLLGIETIK